MSHQCKSIMFHCMDFRLINETHKWMHEQGMLGDCDVVAVAGASKEIVDNTDNGRNLLLKQIETSINLHHSSQVVLFHHSDCGAYGSAYNFKSASEEKEKQFSDMAKAEKNIKEKFPDIQVIKIWAEMQDDSGKKVEFNVI